MNRFHVLSIKRRHAHLETGDSDVADLFIDRKLLQEWVWDVKISKRGEVPFRIEPYESIDFSRISPPSRLLFGEVTPSDDEDEFGRVALLQCSCGCSGCFPVYFRITVSEKEVRWSEPSNPHRDGREYLGSPDQHYRKLAPFVFDRTQYEEAWLNSAKEGGLVSADTFGFRGDGRA